MPNASEMDIHNILQDDRLKATGKLEAIADILYGSDREYFDDFEEGDNGEGDEEEEDED